MALLVAAKTGWRRWERFVRGGVTIKNRRYSSQTVLTTWTCVVILLYLATWWREGFGIRFDPNQPHVISGGLWEADEQVWRGRHLIFCVSPGRAGSKYLSNLLGISRNVLSRHEPVPQMNGEILRQVFLEGQRNETFQTRSDMKVDAIKYVLDGTPQNIVYAETNHMFVKTFADVLLHKLGNIANISVVFLHRPMRDVVWSQLQLGWFLNGHSGKNVWYYDVRDVDGSELPKQIESVKVQSPLDSLVAYNLDVLVRGMMLEKQIESRHKEGDWQNVQIVHAQLDEISTRKGALELLGALQLSVDEKKLPLLGIQDINARDAKKGRIPVHLTLEDVADRVEVLQKQVLGE